MIPTLLLTLVPLAGPLEGPRPAASPAVLAEAPQGRPGAARILREALEGESGPGSLGARLAVARAALRELEDGTTAEGLRTSIERARWRALTDEATARTELERELRRLLTDLEFQPELEADLPAGFPAPTLVREVELKRFPPYRLVRAEMRDRMDERAFWSLFQHIQSEGIAMTTPVETTVRFDGEGEGRTDLRPLDMAFLYGAPDQGRAGEAGDVDVVDVDAAWVLSIGCRGESTEERVQAAHEELLDWLSCRSDLEIAGDFRTMDYNSPRVPDARRYFEVQVPMRWKDRSDRSRPLMDFSDREAFERFSPVDDTVMGGVSSSRFVPTGRGTGVFEGHVSLENNGGFASVRTRPADMGLGDARALTLTVRGDGQRYKLRVRTNDAFDGVSYERPFDTVAGEWTHLVLPLSEFTPVWRGRRVPDAGPLRADAVRSIGWMISDKQEGTFRLEVAELGVE